MGDEFVIIEGKELSKIIEEGMKKLNISNKDEVHTEVLESKKSIFSSYFKVKISKKETEELSMLERNIGNLYDKNLEAEYQAKKLEFSYREDGVYIRISSNVSMPDIVAKMELKQLVNKDITELKQAMEAGTFDTWIKVAEPQEEKLINVACEIKIAKDNMQAFAHVIPPLGGLDITEEMLYGCLKEKRVSFGIKADEIKRIVKEKLYDRDILIAEGIPPVNGEDAVLEYHFDISTDKKFKIDEEGKVNYHELEMIKNVRKGDRLVTLKPHTQGTAGKNIFGEDVPAKEGKKQVLPRGKNVEPTEDGLGLAASKDGEVKLLDGKVNVFSVFEVKADVDNSTGNIRFNGKVVINGNVLTGFVVEADGDVEVYGVVEGAKIVATGNIILHRGILGANRGELYCDGDLIAKFIENSKIEVKGSVQSDAIMHSNVVCGKKLELTGRKGLLVGGIVKVGEEVKAKVIGSPMAATTEIEVGVSPDLRRKYELLRAEMKQVLENLDKTSKAVEMLAKLHRASGLPEDKKVLLAKSIQLKQQLAQRVEEIKNEQSQLEAYFEDINKGKIKISDTVYPGTKVMIGSSMMYVKDPFKFVTFYRANAEIKMSSYEE